ncbi:MAG: hypothetical protein WB660_05960 [Candidatus Sulfotelmatobacter sp.]
MTMQRSLICAGRVLLRLATAMALVVVFVFTGLAGAGGPKYVAGSSYFNPSTMGQPLTVVTGAGQLPQANRTRSVTVTALNETGAPSESKAAPVIGIWTLGDPPGTPPPAFTTAPFNSETFGMSRLDAQILSSSSFIIGIADLRGDGRPDYDYHAHVLYSDSVNPPRIRVDGGAVALQGIGFAPGLTVSVGSVNVSLLATNPSQMLAAIPAQIDGAQTITVTDPVSGAFSIMTNALTFGADAIDKLVLLQGVNPTTPVGTQATNPVIVRVVASDGITPVNGATVVGSTTHGAALSACGARLLVRRSAMKAEQLPPVLLLALREMQSSWQCLPPLSIAQPSQ